MVGYMKETFHNMRYSFAVGWLCLVFAMMGCVGPAMTGTNRQLDEARRLYEQNRFAPAIEILSGVLASQSGKDATCEALYLRGLCYRNQSNQQYVAARRDFEQAIYKQCHSVLTGLSHAALGHIYYESSLEGVGQAIHHYQLALKGLKEPSQRAPVLYRLAVSHQRAGQWTKADAVLKQCFDHFPRSVYADLARFRYRARYFRIQAGAFADRTRAMSLSQKLSAQKWRFDVSSHTSFKKNISNRTLYMVRTGRYPTYAAAHRDTARLANIQTDMVIVPSK